MRRVVLLLVAGCTLPNPAYDPPTGHGGTLVDSSAATSADTAAPTSTTLPLRPDAGLPLGCKSACSSDLDCAEFAYCEQTHCALD